MRGELKIYPVRIHNYLPLKGYDQKYWWCIWVHPHLYKWLNLVPFYDWVIFYFMYVPHLLYSCPCWWTYRLFPQWRKSEREKQVYFNTNMWNLENYHAAAAAAKSLQSRPTLCNPIDGSPPGSPVPGILQARILEWLPFPSPMHQSEKWKGSCSVVSDS